MLLIGALAACSAIASNASAQTATGSLTSGGNNSITIGQNQQFTLTLAVTTNFVSSGYSVFYSIGGGGQNFFGIPNFVAPGTPRTNLSSVFTDPTTSDAAAFNGPGGFARFTFGPSSNSNQFDLGYTGDQINNQAAGTFSLQSLLINSLNATPGTYTITLNRAIMTDRTGGGFNDVPFNATFNVTVVPEPSTVGLAIIGGVALLVVGYRKQRARA
jgi:hypothetical protein